MSPPRYPIFVVSDCPALTGYSKAFTVTSLTKNKAEVMQKHTIVDITRVKSLLVCDHQ